MVSDIIIIDQVLSMWVGVIHVVDWSGVCLLASMSANEASVIICPVIMWYKQIEGVQAVWITA